MKIKCEKSCWTTKPERKWSAGEEVTVPEELGKRLLNNKNFTLADATKGQVTSKDKENVKYRKKRSARSGDRSNSGNNDIR